MGKTMQNFTEQTHTLGLYDPQFEHDACGIGAVVDIRAARATRPWTTLCASWSSWSTAPARTPRARTGDGVGILLQISHKFFLQGGR